MRESSQIPGGRRFLFCAELVAHDLPCCRNDVAAIREVFLDPRIGICQAAGDQALDCTAFDSWGVFHDSLHKALSSWKVNDQLVLYITGHGNRDRGELALRFHPRGATFDDVPFSQLTNALERWGVERAVTIVDTCYSGAATKAAREEAQDFSLPGQVPSGQLILASSHADERSYVADDGSMSTFTQLLVRCLREGMPNQERVIYAPPVIDFINKEMQSQDQRPTFKQVNATTDIWIAQNQAFAGGQEEEAREDSGANDSEYGQFVIIGFDLVGFTAHSEQEQQQLLSRLEQIIDGSEYLSSVRATLNYFGDAVLIAIDRFTIDRIKDVVGAVQKIRKALVRGGPGTEVTKVQSAIHVGNLTIQPSPAPGLGLHAAVRVGGIARKELVSMLHAGEATDVVMSEAFAELWLDDFRGKKASFFGRFAGSGEPETLFVTPESPLYVRFLRDKEVAGTSDILTLHGQIRHRIRSVLLELLSSFEACCDEITKEPTNWDAAAVRASLLVPQASGNGRVLVPTSYRVCRDSSVSTKVGGTRYQLYGDALGEGPAGRCFIGNREQVLCSVPPWSENDPTPYEDYLRADMVSLESIRRFSRRSRAFAYFPVGLMPGRPNGVLCLDSLDPLCHIGEDGLVWAASYLRGFFAERLGILWALRTK